MTKYTNKQFLSVPFQVFTSKKMDQTPSRHETHLNTQIHLREDTQNGYTNKWPGNNFPLSLKG